MNFKLVSKHNMGAVATLLLVILLSQSKVFNFLIDTALGRALLILFILGISYTNKILGVVAVLLIIIMFNHSSIGLMEGFTAADNLQQNSKAEKAEKAEKAIKAEKAEKAVKAEKAIKAVKAEKETFVGREGFNIIDREGTMLRGKRSSEVPVFSSARKQNDDDVEPTDKSAFNSEYASF